MGAQAGEASAFPSGAPGGFDPARPLADPAAAFAQREHIVRQKIVKVETAKARDAVAHLPGLRATRALALSRRGRSHLHRRAG
jgi:hypothetical protein